MRKLFPELVSTRLDRFVNVPYENQEVGQCDWFRYLSLVMTTFDSRLPLSLQPIAGLRSVRKTVSRDLVERAI